MIKLLFLGTGAASVKELYNSCFVINNKEGNLLVDTGGSIEIIERLKYFNINKITDIFITHSHTDHILGLFWLLRRIGEDRLNVYCNDFVYNAINEIINYLYSKPTLERIKKNLNIIKLENKDKKVINGIEYEFFDTYARGIKQYGFKTVIDGKKLVFFGDEPINSLYYNEFYNYDYVIHEVLCHSKDEDRIKPDKLFHSSTRMVGEVMNKLNIKNLILIHTIEDNIKERKNLYITDTKKYFSGNVFVPDDFDIIEVGGK